MSTTAPYAFSGSLTIPPSPGAPNEVLSFSASGVFASRPSDVLNLMGSGTQSVSFGTVPAAGAKAILLMVDADATGTKQPVSLKINGSVTGQVEVAPGGFIALCNPAPSAGITSLNVVYTTDNVVRVWILGD